MILTLTMVGLFLAVIFGVALAVFVWCGFGMPWAPLGALAVTVIVPAMLLDDHAWLGDQQ